MHALPGSCLCIILLGPRMPSTTDTTGKPLVGKGGALPDQHAFMSKMRHVLGKT